MNAPDDIPSLAGEPLDDLDDAILNALADAWIRHDPPPADLVQRIQVGMAVTALEAEVARIVTTEPAAVRSTTYERAHSVTFVSDSLSAMVTAECDGTTRVTVRGWASRGGVEVELRERRRSRRVIVDEEGRFEFAEVERGLVHLVLRRVDDPGARPVITPAFEL